MAPLIHVLSGAVCLWQIHHNKQFVEIRFFFFFKCPLKTLQLKEVCFILCAHSGPQLHVHKLLGFTVASVFLPYCKR